MAYTGELLKVTDAFEKEAAKFRHLFKGQQPWRPSPEMSLRKNQVYPGTVTWMTTGEKGPASYQIMVTTG